MLYILIFLVPLIFIALLILCLPEVTRKGNIVKIGTIINKKYNLQHYRFVVQAEKRSINSAYVRGSSFRKSWFVCIYVYPKNEPTAVSLRTHLLSVAGFRKSALKKETKIRKLLK
jgi:hypothetical protein